MNVPLQIRCRDVPREQVEELVRAQAAKLERYCDHLSSCRVAVERPQRHQRTGSPYRVRIDLTVPPGHELAAVSEPAEGDIHDTLDTVVLRTFKAARRSLKRLAALQRGDVKRHDEPREEPGGEGPQASSVQVAGKPGARAPRSPRRT